jgi:hypothetical protein
MKKEIRGMMSVRGLGVMLTAAALVLCCAGAFAQEAPRSIYVSAQGSDDNNGRSEEGAFKTLEKAFSVAAQGVVKTIAVIGSVGGSCSVRDVGEITLIGKGEGAKATGALALSGNSTVRVERLAMSEGVSITGGAVVTLGEGVKVSDNGIKVEGRSSLTLESDAEIANCGGVGIALAGGEIVLKDNAVISNCYGGVSGSGALTMSGAAKIVKNSIKDYRGNASGYGGGVNLEDGSFTMSGDAVIEGNSASIGGGVYIEGGSFVMRDNAAVTGNSAGNGGGIAVIYTRKFNSFTIGDNAVVAKNEAGEMGGGIFIGCGGPDYEKTFNGAGDCVLQDNAVISENKSKFGGGVYYAGAAFYYEGFKFGTVGVSVSHSFGGVVMRDNVLIKNNSAGEGGGVYANGGRIQEIMVASSSYKIGIGYMRYGFVMEGGSVEGNAADFGAGVYACAIATKERRLDRSVWKETKKTITAAGFTLNGGSIAGNRAEFVGGGVYQKTKEAFVQNGKGVVAGNEAGDGAGEDVFIPQ